MAREQEQGAEAMALSVPMEITARPIAPKDGLYGFASVKIGGITVDDFKIVENKNGELFVGMPSKPDKTSRTGYRNTVRLDPEIREAFGEAVLGAYHEAVDRAQERAANLRSAPEKPPRMAEQIKAAEKEAAAHNAARPPKDKGGPKRETERT